MKLNRFLTLCTITIVLTSSACKKEKDDGPELNNLPAFFIPKVFKDYGKVKPEMVLVASNREFVNDPWDIDFHPTRANELWILNKGTEQTGGTTVTLKNAGMSNQEALFRKDQNSWHFMALPSALSFGPNGDWATSAEILDANRRGGSFTGPSLWSGNMSIYAQPSGGNGSHLDMLHGSPYSMGIESDNNGNAYWVFDGYNKHICKYDFNQDHGPGNSDHDDGTIHRYTELTVTREPGVPSHMVLDKNTKWLYIADPANSRILMMNTKTGTKKSDIPLVNEVLAQHWEMEGLEWKVFTNINLKKPAGIEISQGLLYVSDYETGEIVAYNLSTQEEMGRISTGKSRVMGIKANTDGKLWFVANGSNEIYRIDPK
jgi:outer membrane protein assembly factor BamB